jgi:Methyltransferase domain
MKNPPAHAPGHFYSPVNDSDQIDAGKLSARRASLNPSDFPELRLDLASFEQLWKSFAPYQRQFAFPPTQNSDFRYYSVNPVYGVGDALILHSMIGSLKPRRIVEIGSGFSSAAMLDTVDQFKIDTKITFIEPYPDRLKALLRPDDWTRCEIVLRPIQDTSSETYSDLGNDDILFVDSTHVMKSGSDVNFEIFEILPRLSTGVVVHFHDIFWPFEYPADWLINRGYSWNELYGLRAFLAYNEAFDVIFFNDLFGLRCHTTIQETDLPAAAAGALRSMGGGLWLKKRL